MQDRFLEDPVHMAMIISRNLKEEKNILATAKSAEVKPAAFVSVGRDVIINIKGRFSVIQADPFGIGNMTLL